LEQYQKKYKESIENPNKFWGELARELITWHKPFTHVKAGSFTHGDMTWFADGELSPCYNLVDRHALKHPDNVPPLPSFPFPPDAPKAVADL